MAVIQALLAAISKSAGKILNAIFGWAVRALFGQTSAKEQTFLSVVVGGAVAWPILLVGIIIPKIAALMLAFVPLPHWVPSWIVRLVWTGLAVIVPVAVGLAVAAKAPPPAKHESVAKRILRGFPITIGLAAAFLIMFVSVPLMRLAAIVRGHKTSNVPLITEAAGYHDVARKICEVLNRHAFDFHRGTPGWWVAAPTRILLWFGGDAFRGYVPAKLEYFVTPELEMSMYPSGVMLRGKPRQLTWAHGLIAETVVHTDGIQTSAAQAQALERRLREIWYRYDQGAKTAAESQRLARVLDDVTRELGKLEVEFDDWQVLYRQILQVGRAIHGERQLMDQEASEGVIMNEHNPVGSPTQMGTGELVKQIGAQAEILVHKQIELAKAELKHDLKAEATAFGGLGVSAVLAVISVTLLLVTGALALSLVLPAWAAGLIVTGVMLAVTLMVALISWKKRVSTPMSRTRKTLSDDVRWAKERLT
ncbi:MAG TPA: phage holin family protein [Polyangia bacterium]|nr:phage holin family protein [Polyangia bacterium]